MGQRGRNRPLFIVYCSLVILVTWALCLYRLDSHSFWYDEGYSVFVAAFPSAELLHWTAREFTPPLYHSLLALWLPLAGWTEFAARFLSVWTGTLLVAGMIRLGRDLCSWAAGFLVGLLAAISPFYIWHSQDTRMYMPQALFGLLGTILLVRALRAPRRWGLWIGFALLDALTLYTHTTGGFLLVFHAFVVLAAGLWSSERFLLWKRGGLALVGAIGAWLPWLTYALPFLGENAGYWAGQLNWQFVVSGAFQGFVTGGMMDGTAATAATVVWAVACLAGILILLLLKLNPHRPGRAGAGSPQTPSPACSTAVRAQNQISPNSNLMLLFSPANRGWKTALFLLAYFAVPVAAMALLFRAVPKFSPRYLIFASPPVFLLPAIGSAALLRRPGVRRVWGALLLTALVTTAGLGLSNLYFSPAYAKSDFRAAAQTVRELMAPDEIVLIVPGHTFPVWQFYFGPEGWVALPDDPILDVRHVLHYRDTVGRLNDALAGLPNVKGSAAARSGVWLVEWEPWVVDPTDLVVHLLEQVGEEVALPQRPAGLRLRHYRLAGDALPLPSEPTLSPPEVSSLDLSLTLTGCVLPQQIRGDEKTRVGCYWEARDTLPHHLSVSARLVDTAGVEWGRADAAISGPYLVAGRWPMGELVLGQYILQPLPGIPPGDFYQLQLHVYEPDGTTHGMATGGSVVVARPANPFTETISSVLARLGGLALETASVDPHQVLPGAEVRVEAVWRVTGPFHEPRLTVAGSTAEVPLLPPPGATDVWETGDVYRTVTRVPIPPRALGGPTDLWAVSEAGEILIGTVRVDVTRTFTLPAEVRPADYRLGDPIFLAGTHLSVGAGEMVEVVLYWRAETLIEQSYTVFVHLVGPDGQIYAQADGLPQAGRHPTTHWLPGEVVADSYRLELPADAPPGQYRVLAGLYDLTTLERLPVTAAAGNPAPDDAILIGSWEVP